MAHEKTEAKRAFSTEGEEGGSAQDPRAIWESLTPAQRDALASDWALADAAAGTKASLVRLFLADRHTSARGEWRDRHGLGRRARATGFTLTALGRAVAAAGKAGA